MLLEVSSAMNLLAGESFFMKLKFGMRLFKLPMWVFDPSLPTVMVMGPPLVVTLEAILLRAMASWSIACVFEFPKLVQW